MRRFAYTAGLLFLIGQGSLLAFTFSPISQEFSPEGKNSSHVFSINNDSLSERIAVKVSVFKRTMDEEGLETLEPCPGDFLIYPAQSILDPGESRSVRIKWQGGSVGGEEKAYRIIAEQLPVDFREEDKQKDGAGIRFTFRYEGTLYVVPFGAEPAVELNSVSTVLREGENWLKLDFENRGSRHVLLNGLEISLDSPYGNFETILLQTEELGGIAGENLLARSSRTFYIPEPPAVMGEELIWNFSFQPVY